MQKLQQTRIVFIAVLARQAPALEVSERTGKSWREFQTFSCDTDNQSKLVWLIFCNGFLMCEFELIFEAYFKDDLSQIYEFERLKSYTNALQ